MILWDKRATKGIRNNFVIALFIFAITMMSFPASAATKPKLSKKTVTISVGETVQLKVKGTKSKVKWTSSNKNVATVSKKGKVVGKKAGSVTIKAKVGKYSLKCKITVQDPPQPANTSPSAPPSTPASEKKPEMSLSATQMQLIVGKQAKLTLNNSAGCVVWSSSNYQVADVSSDGTVYAKFLGNCIIKAICDGQEFSCVVKVEFPVPECYPNNAYIDNSSLPEYKIKIDLFEARFVSYEPYRDATATIDSITYFFPYTYRIHLKGKGTANTKRACRFSVLWDGRTPDMPGNVYIQIPIDENGDFDFYEDVKFSSPAGIIYLT